MQSYKAAALLRIFFSRKLHVFMLSNRLLLYSSHVNYMLICQVNILQKKNTLLRIRPH